MSAGTVERVASAIVLTCDHQGCLRQWRQGDSDYGNVNNVRCKAMDCGDWVSVTGPDGVTQDFCPAHPGDADAYET